jgi:hypothetical protein
LKTLISVEPEIVSALDSCPGNRGSCFELYGFDILIDSDLRPWLLEVNVLPSMSSSSMFDKKVKTTLICDVLTLVGVRGYDKKKVHEDPEFEKPVDQKSFTSSSKVPKAFKGQEKLTNDEYNLIADHEDEFSRKGNFSRIFPLAANVDYYEKFFLTPRYFNRILWAYLRGGTKGQELLAKVYKRVYNQNI